MTRRLDRYTRALPVLAMAAASALLNAQTPPASAPATLPATQSAVPATQPATTQSTDVVPAPPVVVSIPATTQTSGQNPASRPVQKIRLEFKDASVESVLDYLSEVTGFIIVKEVPVEGKVSITSRGSVTPEEALTILNASLMTNGYTAIQQGRVLKIVRRTDAKHRNIPVFFGSDPETIAETDELITQVIPLKSVDAAKLRQDLQPLISADADFAANAGSNSLIITDSSANIRRVVKIVKNLDTHEGSASNMMIRRLTFANAASAAKLIQQVFGNEAEGANGGGGGRTGGRGAFLRMMMAGGGGPGGPPGGGAAGGESGKAAGKVTAAADERTNTLVVTAPTDTVKLIDDLLKVLDSDPVPGSVVKVFQLEFADAATAAKLINTVFQPETSISTGGGGGGGGRYRGGDGGGAPSEGRLPPIEGLNVGDRNVKVNAAAADRTNTLVVTAPPDTLKLISEIIHALDTDPAAMSEVRVFQLQFADSASAAKLISSVFQTDTQSGGGGGGGGNKDTPGHLPAIGGLSTSLHGGRVNASSDDRTNTLVVTAPGDAMKIITAILKELDSNPSSESAMFIYHLRNGVAQDMANTLNALFGGSTNGTGGSTAGRTASQSLVSSGLGSSSGFGGGGGRSGGLGGSSGGSFGAPLSSSNNTGRGTFSVGGTSTGGTSGSNQNGANRTINELTGQVFVVADVDTNSLLVNTANKYRDRVKKIIEELDRPVPQVLIKVLVVEVTHEKTNDFGIDFSVLNTRANGKGITGAQGLGNAAAAAAQPAGLVVSYLEDHVNATLHALATEGKLDVLSRPYILASDNQQASITVGQEVPFITNTQITDTGQQINSITYQAVGIILNVTPHISPDGLVVLDVAPEISQLTGTQVPIGNNVSAPVIANRSAQSRVAIRNGNTIVIGGMMQDQKTTTIAKVPILGDIPYLGSLFQRYQDDRTKTELLIFLTPHVAQQADALANMSKEELKTTDRAPTAVEPGAFQKHYNSLQAGATAHEATTNPAAIDIKAVPSTQPFNGVMISGPSTNPAGRPLEPGK